MQNAVDFSQLLLPIITAIALLTAGLASLLYYVRKQSEKSVMERYDREKHKAEIEYMRKNLELQLYEVSKKLEENADRWRDMNHLVLTSQNRFENSLLEKKSIVTNNYLRSLGILEEEMIVDKKLVFVLTPFHDEFWTTFQTVKDVCQEFNLICIRGDENFVEGEILPTIVRHIVRARIVIGNITGRNPNVLYELGIAHGLGKSTLLIARDLTDVPFDLNSKRIILFKTPEHLETQLRKSIPDILLAAED